MFARVTRLKVAKDQIEAGTTNFKETVMPAAEQQKGCLGGAMIISSESDLAAGVTYWDTLSNLNDSEEMGVQARLQAATATKGEVIDVDRFEVPIAHRPAGSITHGFTRLNEISGDPTKLEAAITFVRGTVVSNLSAQPGYLGLTMGVNRMTGRCFVTSTWDSVEARERSNKTVTGQRSQVAEMAGAKSVKVTLGELVYARLTLPAAVG